MCLASTSVGGIGGYTPLGSVAVVVSVVCEALAVRSGLIGGSELWSAFEVGSDPYGTLALGSCGKGVSVRSVVLRCSPWVTGVVSGWACISCLCVVALPGGPVVGLGGSVV